MKSKHTTTPGFETSKNGQSPNGWRWSTIQLHNPERFKLLDSRGVCFARVEFLCNDELLEPVASRIAAAPELLAMVKELVEQPTWHRTLAPRESDLLSRANAMIAQAKGQP